MTHSLLTPSPVSSPSNLSVAITGSELSPSFCEQNRAIVATFLHTQGAILSMIQSIASQAVDGQGDMEQALRNIDLVATKSSGEANMMAVAVSSIRITTNQ
ncbi:hypothetical protein ACF8GD_00200 [Pseudomonas putida]|uniref:hypothetical protein n=1 Tax=Pseudomonas putida TaxID=303 RepID=UPI00370A9084